MSVCNIILHFFALNLYFQAMLCCSQILSSFLRDCMEFEVRSMSSAYAITEIFSLGLGEVAPNCESCNCLMRSFMNVAKMTGDRTEPCRTPFPANQEPLVG